MSPLAVLDPVLESLRKAPLDDEPFTEEDRLAYEEGLEDYRSGRTVTSKELRAALDL